MSVKYPEVEVQLVGEDGSAFVILMKIERALKLAGVSPDEVLEFRTEATSGNYDHLLQTAMAWVNVT